MADNSYVEGVELAIDNVANHLLSLIAVEEEKNKILKGIENKLSDIAIIQSFISESSECCAMRVDPDESEELQSETYFEKINNHSWRYYPQRIIKWV